jgi:hypothetical protein
MTISPSPITHIDLYIGKDGNSTMYIKNVLDKTIMVLVPEYLTTILLCLAKVCIENKDTNLSVTNGLVTAKEIRRKPEIFLRRTTDIGSYVYKIRKIINDAGINNDVVLNSQDFIVSKRGWGYGIHPNIQLTLHN